MTRAGLILEGGGMRGVYTAGALDCFLDEGLYFPTIFAVSAGACHACSYISGQRGRAFRTVADFLSDKRYASAYSLLTTGDFFGVDFVYREIPDALLPFDYAAYKGSAMSMHTVLTNCETGRAEYPVASDLRRDMVYVQASSSLPLLSRMVKIGGKRYLDGGISDSIPLRQSIFKGNEKNVVILTQHREYSKKPSSVLPLLKLRYRRYPALIESAKTRHDMYNNTLAYIRAQENGGKAFVLAPSSPVTIGRVEKNLPRLQALYDRGYAETKRQIPALRKYLEQK